MQELDDITLLRKYASEKSEEAFATLVTRHINKVYSVALRHTNNPGEAEEITQAVFVILAQKSASLAADWRGRFASVPRLAGADGITTNSLAGWLYQTARLTSVTFLRSAARRARREQEAHMQSVLNEVEPDVWEQISPLLDAAMATLNQTDRHAVVLRFFDGKSMNEIGAVLGATEDAIKKRVGRALMKLQGYFARRGIDSTTDTIAQAISTNSIQTAPAALVKSVTAVALAKGAAASLSTLTLVKASFIAMKAKTIATTAAVTAAAMMLGGGAYFVYHLATAHPATKRIKFIDAAPVAINNISFKPDGDRNGTFLVEVDPDTQRTSNSVPAVHIKGPITDSSNAEPIAANGTYKRTDNSSSTRYYVTDSSVLYGKHIRLTAWLKTRDVRGWASAFVIIIGMDGRHMQYDDMSDRPIRGTTDWQQYEFVTDLPKEPCIIYFGPDLYGPGELWADDFQIDLAPADEPSTDDRNWRLAGESDTPFYSEATDYTVTHNGHPTACITCAADAAAAHGMHTRLAHDFYGPDSDKFCGHTVRMTGWVKIENVSGRIEPNISPYAGWYKLLAKDSMARDSSIKGTSDWTQFSVTCTVPDDTEYLDTGFNFFGSGKVWIDTDSVKLEIVK